MNYNKPPLSIQDQVSLLKNRGMLFDDDAFAEHCLNHINYYRLRSYWIVFESDPQTHIFETNTNFNDVLNLYQFDRQLRLLVLDAIERVETSVRTQWAYEMAQAAGAHAYLDISLLKPTREDTVDKIKVEVDRAREVFIEHYNRKYSNPAYPPIWAVCEVMSFGTLSKSYSSIQSISLRSDIAKKYALDERVLESFLRHLNYIRNLCAHHGRLWNRRSTTGFQFPRTKPSSLARAFNYSEPKKLYNTCVMLIHLLEIINPGSSWKQEFIDLKTEHNIDVTKMGFPNGWQSLGIWQ